MSTTPSPESRQPQAYSAAENDAPDIPQAHEPPTRKSAHEQASQDQDPPEWRVTTHVGRSAVQSAASAPAPYEIPPVRTQRPRSRFAPRQPTPPAAEQSGPRIQPEIDKNPLPGSVRVQKVQEKTKVEKDNATGNDAGRQMRTMPDERAIAQATNAGRPLARFFSWYKGEAHVTGTPESVPQTAPTRSLAEPAQSAHTSDGTRAAAGGTATAVLDRPVPQNHTAWARLKPTFVGVGDAESTPETTTQDPHTKLEEVVRKHSSDNFTVAIVGRGVTPEEQERLIIAETNQSKDALKTKLSPRATSAATTHARTAGAYQVGRQQSGLLHETVAVGVEDIAKLEEMAEDTSRSILNGGTSNARYIRFEVERNPDGSVKRYDSLDDVLAADAADSFVVTAGEYAAHVELPDEPLPGLPRETAPTNFDVDRTIPEGVRKTKFAEILDNNGNPTGRPLYMTNEHTGILAQTNAGKSVLIDAIITDKQHQNYEREMAAKKAGETTWEHEAVFVFDCKKEDEFTTGLSSKIKGVRTSDGSEIPDKFATVHHAVPGTDGPGLRFNLIKPLRNDPQSWRTRITQAANILAAPYKGMKGEVYKTLKQYLGSSIRRGVKPFGLDPDTGRSMYPHGTPYTPPGEYMSDRVEDVARSLKLRGDYGTNIVGYAKSEIETAYKGTDGAPLAAEGYDWDARAALELDGVVSIDLKHQQSIEARQITVLSALYDIYDACVQKNQELGLGTSTDMIHATVIIDEADIFTNDDLGAALADFFTYARSVGMRIIYAKQGNIEDSIHSQVWLNTPNKLIGRTGFLPDLTAFAGASGKTTLEDMESTPGAAMGEFTYYGFGMARAVRGLVANPHNPEQTPRGTPVPTAGIERMVQMGMDQELFDLVVKIEARAHLAVKPEAAQISSWAEDAVLAVLSGRGLHAAGPQLQAILHAGLNDPANPGEATLTRCIISEAVQNAINGRPDLQWKAPREAYAKHIIPHLQALARGEPLEGWDQPRLDLALDVGVLNPAYDPTAPEEDDNSWKQFEVHIDGRFGHMKDQLREMMDGPVHERTDEFAEKLGLKLYAIAAYEQREDFRYMRLEAVNEVTKCIGKTMKNGPLGGADLSEVQPRIANIVGGLLTSGDMTPEEVRAAATDIITQKIFRQNKHALSSDQAKALRHIIDSVPLALLTKDMGFDTALEEIYEGIRANEGSQKGFSAEDFLALTGQPAKATTAKGQLKQIVQELEQQHMAQVSYAMKIMANKLLFGIDTIRAGHAPTLDGNVAVLMKEIQPDGPIFESPRLAAGESGEVVYTLGEMMQAGKFEAWKNAVAEHFIFSHNIVRNGASMAYINRLFTAVTRQLWKEYQDREMLRKRNASGKEAEAGKSASDPFSSGMGSGVPA